ncbi:MAG: sigma-54 dependent transcriptional regulator [Planctomycetota bacterium]|nr:sigma-54 dependent transcriptional regulator [Planctomycetota bacterium]
MRVTVLILGSDPVLGSILERALGDRDCHILKASTPQEARQEMRAHGVSLLVIECSAPLLQGLELVRESKKIHEDLRVLAILPAPNTRLTVQAVRAGVDDVMERGSEPDILAEMLSAAFEAIEQKRGGRPPATPREGPSEILGESPAIEKVRSRIREVAPTDCAVLLVGETGTGKDLAASWIHHLSSCPDGPFVAVNSGCTTEELSESELFGHEKGAFTGATGPRSGLFKQADGGTIFFDEIAEMAPRVQTKLLRVLDSGRFRPVGGHRELQVEARVIAATNRTLEAAIRSGAFRKDLYYRLKEYRLEIPPLRERGGDVLSIARDFLRSYGQTLHKGPLGVTPEAARVLLDYRWPGNVRELRNELKHAAIRCETEAIGPKDLSEDFQSAALVGRWTGADGGRPLSLRQMKRRHVNEILRRVEGNVSAAARLLGISRSTLKLWLSEWRSSSFAVTG